MHVKCDNCDYEWEYTGRMQLASCPSCAHKVKADVSDATRRRAPRGFSFPDPDVSESRSEGRLDLLKEILKEITEINRRTEEMRRVLEELLRREEAAR